MNFPVCVLDYFGFDSFCLIIFPSVMVSSVERIFPSLIFVFHSFTLTNLSASPIIFVANTGLLDHHEIAVWMTYWRSLSDIIGQCWLNMFSSGKSRRPSLFFTMDKISANL